MPPDGADKPDRASKPRLGFRQWLRQSLPQEHGSWAFVAEPCLIGALRGRPLSGLGAFLLFLAYRPTKLFVQDIFRKKRFTRTLPNGLASALLGAAGFGAILLSQDWLIFGLLLAFGSLFLALDLSLPGRSLARELGGALLCLPVAAGADHLIWPILVLRPIVSVLSVRGVIDRMEDARTCRWAAAGLAVGLAVAASNFFGFSFRTLAYGVAALRAPYLAFTSGRKRAPVHIGLIESVVAASVLAAWAADLLFAAAQK